jgi:hypothetical protein
MNYIDGLGPDAFDPARVEELSRPNEKSQVRDKNAIKLHRKVLADSTQSLEGSSLESKSVLSKTSINDSSRKEPDLVTGHRSRKKKIESSDDPCDGSTGKASPKSIRPSTSPALKPRSHSTKSNRTTEVIEKSKSSKSSFDSLDGSAENMSVKSYTRPVTATAVKIQSASCDLLETEFDNDALLLLATPSKSIITRPATTGEHQSSKSQNTTPVLSRQHSVLKRQESLRKTESTTQQSASSSRSAKTTPTPSRTASILRQTAASPTTTEKTKSKEPVVEAIPQRIIAASKPGPLNRDDLIAQLRDVKSSRKDLVDDSLHGKKARRATSFTSNTLQSAGLSCGIGLVTSPRTTKKTRSLNKSELRTDDLDPPTRRRFSTQTPTEIPDYLDWSFSAPSQRETSKQFSGYGSRGELDEQDEGLGDF